MTSTQSGDVCIAHALTAAKQSLDFVPKELQEISLGVFGKILSEETRAAHMEHVSSSQVLQETMQHTEPEPPSAMETALKEAQKALQFMMGPSFTGFRCDDANAIVPSSATAPAHNPQGHTR